MITIRTAPRRPCLPAQPRHAEHMLEVRHHDRGYAVFDGAKMVSRRFSTMATAIAHANQMENEANLTERKCLCCSTTFMSTGPGHRMCNTCRAVASTMA